MPTIRSIAVIGAGRAGREFAVRCVRAGFQVVLEDVLPSKLRLAQEEFAEQHLPHEGAGSLTLAGTVEEAVRDADLAIDFMPDDLESKLEIFSMLDRMAPPRTLLCSPIEKLSITDLASCTYRPERCVALRGDLHDGRIAMVPGRLTATETLSDTSDWLHSLGYAVSLVDDREEPMLVKNILHQP